jgi:hypothetical protein
MDVGSLREDIDFEEDFPLDFSNTELNDPSEGSGEVEVPF